jgi:hypothetical protein
MKYRNSLVGGLSAALFATSAAVAQEQAEVVAKFTAGTTQNVDFDTTTLSAGVRAITSYGLIQCDFSRTSGETRIDTFDDVFGVSPVTNKPWNNFGADKYQCGYGLKLILAGGELTSGIGMMRYSGETDTSDEGKEITADAISVKAGYKRGDYETKLELLEKSYGFLYHYTSPSVYDSDTRGKVRTLDLSGKWGPVHAEAEYVQGSKEREFTTPLFPYADFDYTQTTLSIGPRFNGGIGPLRYIAPTFISGSEAGSFNELNLDSGLRGLVAGLEFDKTTMRLTLLTSKSEGSRDYSPVSNDLAEAKEVVKLGLELTNDKWAVKLENKRSEHDGDIVVNNVAVGSTILPYAMLVGCGAPPCSYNNYRKENELKVSWRYSYSDTIALHGDLYQRQRDDQQYEGAEHNYKETGGKIGVAVTF